MAFGSAAGSAAGSAGGFVSGLASVFDGQLAQLAQLGRQQLQDDRWHYSHPASDKDRMELIQQMASQPNIPSKPNPKTYREELQQEVDIWLKDVA